MRQVVLIVVGLLAGAPLSADELAEARAQLEQAGIRVSATGVVLAKEAELNKELGKAPALKRNVLQTEKDLKAAELQVQQFERNLMQLRQQRVQYSAQLANINPNDITLNNKLVSALEVNKGQIDLVERQKRQFDDQVKSSRSRANEAREAYIELALTARKLADDITAEYPTKAADPAVQAALGRYNQAAKRQFILAATAALQASVRRLKQIEDTVLSESIELQGDDGRTMRVNVVVNGKQSQEMVLDSGASAICLPQAVADKFGLKPTDKDPRVELRLADGRTIDGRLMKLASVRVGKFTVDNVECVVLAEEALGAEPLLGMSFLEHFKFEVDAAAKKLTMVKVSGTEGAAAKK